MAIRRLTNERFGLYLRITLFVLLLGSLYLMSSATENSEQFGALYLWLLIFNGTCALMLSLLIGHNLWTLLKQYRAREVGSRLTMRLVWIFILLSVIPVTALYYFSLQFLHRGIDSWFDVKIETALDDSLELSRTSLDSRMRHLLHETNDRSKALAGIPEEIAILSLAGIRSALGARELTLSTIDGRIIGSSTQDLATLVPTTPNNETLSRMQANEPTVGLIPLEDGLHIRVLVPVTAADPAQPPHILQALYQLPSRVSALVESVEQTVDAYKQAAFLRGALKQSFMLTLFLVLLITLLSAVWAAFFAARRLISPVLDLAEGTRAVAEGDYSKQLPMAGKDELGFLVRSFNAMTRRIAQARDEAKRSQQQVERQRTYLETVMAHLSSGVLTLNAEYLIRTGNSSAEHILNIALPKLVGERLDTMAERYPHLEKFVDLLAKHVTTGQREWSQEVSLFGPEGKQILICRGVAMPAGLSGRGGYVIVFDDITNLIQAQRDAAWGEVARRLAHEIKNPLTPIQLAAERLRRKYLGTMAPEDADLLDRSTNTIVQQVGTMKAMVNAFTDYARVPQIILRPIRLNNLVREVADLFQESKPHVIFHFDLDNNLPELNADSDRLRQVFNNLFSNAIEACEGQPQGDIHVHTGVFESSSLSAIEIIIEDSGSGFSSTVADNLFEPYVTTKEKGTGLGLPIVKKIVEEHSGIIMGENSENGGARFIIRFPITDHGDQPGLPPLHKEPSR